MRIDLWKSDENPTKDYDENTYHFLRGLKILKKEYSQRYSAHWSISYNDFFNSIIVKFIKRGKGQSTENISINIKMDRKGFVESYQNIWNKNLNELIEKIGKHIDQYREVLELW